MFKEIIIILYYLLIINLLSCGKINNNILYNYTWILILLNINKIIFNISYSIYINNIIIFFDMMLSILIIKELILYNKNKNKNNIHIKLLYSICIINIIVFIYNIYSKNNIINTI